MVDTITQARKNCRFNLQYIVSSNHIGINHASFADQEEKPDYKKVDSRKASLEEYLGAFPDATDEDIQRVFGTVTYTVLDDLNREWDSMSVNKFIDLWNDGTDFRDIAKHFNRDQDEVGLLLIHLSRQGKIKQRKNGIWGG